MNQNEDNRQKFIIIGGCHVAGFGAEGSPSFIDIIEKKLNLKNIFKKSSFQLQHSDRLRFILENYQSNLILLQVGNNEFNASLMHLLLFLNRTTNISTNTLKVSVVKNDTFDWRKSWLFFFVSFLKLVLINIIWVCEKMKNRGYLYKFRDIIKENANKTFVIISPFPSNYAPSNITRKRAGYYYKYLFNLSNVRFINSFEDFHISDEMFFDQYHLNAVGHEVLGNNICNALTLIKNSTIKMA